MENNYIITRSNYFVLNSRYELSVEEQKIILTLASMVQPNDEDFKPYIFKINEFAKMLGIKNKSLYTEIPKITKELMKKVFEIQEDNRILQIAWLSSADYRKGTGFVELEFSPKLKPYMLRLKDSFTRYNLRYALNMNSKYSPRIYELMKCNQFKCKYFEIELDKLKYLLKLESVYSRYIDFKRYVVLRTQREINELTDIIFNFEEIKTGRKVTALKFYINENKKNITNIDKKLDVVNEMSNDQNINKDKSNKFAEAIIEVEESKKLIAQVREIIKEKITNADILKILQAANNDIELIKKQYKISKTTGNIKNLVGWLIRAIKDNYKEPVTATKPNQFTNYEQREYDFEELERKRQEKFKRDMEKIRREQV